MDLPHFSLAAIQRAATQQSFERGEQYFASGAVVNLSQWGNTLCADVEGNTVDAYQVVVTFDGGGITDCDCSCPYDWGGWCKHIVAVLLTCIHEPETIQVRPSLAELLARLDLAQAKSFIETLANKNYQVLEALDLFVNQASYRSSTSAPRQRKTRVDPTPFKRRVRAILENTIEAWDSGADDDSIAGDIEELIQDVLVFVDQGDSDSALILMEGITEACSEHWHLITDYVGSSFTESGIDLDAAWTEVILSADLTDEENISWQETIEGWEDSLGYFAMAIEALRQGWDYPPLQQVFQGVPRKYGPWSHQPPSWGQDFNRIRLKVLDRQQRYDEYLQLAKATGETQAYLTMLGRLGRVEEVMAIAQETMTTLEEAKALAETLREHNHIHQALAIAMIGLTLACDSDYVTADFATWTANLAEGLGDTAAQLTATLTAFKAQPSLKDYRAIQTLVGDDWPATRKDLLEELRHSNDWANENAKIDIFLQENLLDDAVRTVSNPRAYYDQQHYLAVMDAVIATHSQWVIETAIAKAESIMNEGRAKDYTRAVAWLQRAKAAYQASGKEADWLNYRQHLSITHTRKHKLIDLFRQHSL